MPTIIIDNREFEIPSGVKLNCIQAAGAGGRGDSALLLASRADGGGQLPHVPDRSRLERRQNRQNHDAAETRSGVQPDGGRGDGHRHQQ